MTYKPDVLVGSDLHYMGILALKERLRAMDRVDIIHDFDYELLQTEHYDLIENKTDKHGVLEYNIWKYFFKITYYTYHNDGIWFF